ncbi:MAG: sulfotransferase, partial [Planctomycetes bacterium]|nr:sulfotransferase [Planctomycetota bacterium]
MLVVILGMHRSGTSSVARALYHGGMYCGSKLMNDTTSDNLLGHSESWETVNINDDILAASGASWDRITDGWQLVVSDEHHRRIESFLADLAQHPVAGFKDPRTLLTLPAWEPHLPDYQIVACLRHPNNVAQSLQLRHSSNDWSLERGLALWHTYNSRLLKYVETQPNVLWYDFDRSIDDLAATLAFIYRRLGLHYERPLATLLNSCLRHHVDGGKLDNPAIADLYETLRAQADAQFENCIRRAGDLHPTAIHKPDTLKGCETKGLSSAEHRVSQLELLLGKYDEILQHHESRLGQMEIQNRNLHVQLTETRRFRHRWKLPW